MKTPREILFQRHQDATPKLDAVRRTVLAGLNHQDTKTRSWTDNFVSLCLGGSYRLWRELIFSVPPDLDGLGCHLGFDFRLQCFAAGQIGTGRAKIAAALARSDHGLATAGTAAGGIDRAVRDG